MNITTPCRPNGRVPLVLPVLSSASLTTRRGITLVEMLVALAVTLLMMGAVVTVFGFIGESVSDNRSMIEINDRLRSAAHRLREDLSSITVDPIPWQRPEAGAGYLEIIEGPARDYVRGSGNTVNTFPGGDVDDMMLFTVRSPGDPYRGRFGNTAIESHTAEVIWYARVSTDVATNPPTFTLCRRQLLIVPQAALDAANPPRNAAAFYDAYDVSAQLRGGVKANTLGSLTMRENRFAHISSTYPHTIVDAIRTPFADTRQGEEVVLTNVISFNVQVFDPSAEIRWNGSAAFEPRDPGYVDTNNSSLVKGTYMDLGDTTVPGALFGVIPPNSAGLKSLLDANRTGYATYDTWSFHYEHDGIRQPSASISGVIDAGTNGLDDNAIATPRYPGIDDMSERETSPPYPYPLRGLRVNIRVFEPSSKQIREVTIVQSFVPE